MFTILIIEDDTDTCSELENAISGFSDFQLIAISNNSDEAITLVNSCLPNAIILDLELHNGSGNGLQVLLSTQSLSYKPYILVTTNNSSKIIHEAARKYGADFIMTKYQKNYSAGQVIEHLYLMKDIISKQQNSSVPDSVLLSQKSERIKKRVSRELDLVGISHKKNGYLYLQTAIILAINYYGKNVDINLELSKQFHTKKNSIVRSMNYAIEDAWTKMPPEVLLQHYGARINAEKGKPTVTEFIYYYATKIRDDLLV